jgi:hypothetical protein
VIEVAQRFAVLPTSRGRPGGGGQLVQLRFLVVVERRGGALAAEGDKGGKYLAGILGGDRQAQSQQ